MHFILSGLGVFIGFYLGWVVGIINLGFINLFCSITLWFYSTHFKRAFLSGNLIISLLAALVYLIIPLYEIIPSPEVNSENAFYVILNYAVFAFFTTFIREVIKDFEDAEGDKKMGYKTFAIVSQKSAKRSIQFITILLIIILGLIATLQFTYSAIYAALYVVIAIEIPLLYFFIKSLSAKNKKSYHFLSQLIKLIMITGILSILVFTFLFLN